MFIKKGEIKIHHFAHYPDDENYCPYSTGESEEHLKAKMNLYNTAKERGIEVKVEDVLSEHVRADVTFMTSMGKVAVEFQRSGMSVDKIVERMKNYGETRIPVIWVMLKGDEPEYFDITTKDIVFYKMYGNQLYTYYKNGLIDVWMWKYSRSRGKTHREWFYIDRISLFSFKKFKVYEIESVNDSGFPVTLLLPRSAILWREYLKRKREGGK